MGSLLVVFFSRLFSGMLLTLLCLSSNFLRMAFGVRKGFLDDTVHHTFGSSRSKLLN